MARSITVEPGKLDTASQKMDSVSADYERLYKQLKSEVDGMGAAWQGQDNREFVQKIQDFQTDFEQMFKLMKEYSEFLRTSAKHYKDTQDSIITAAKKLTS